MHIAPILQIRNAQDIAAHLRASPLAPSLAYLHPSQEWLTSFFAPHVALAAALAMHDAARPLPEAHRLLVFGDANHAAFAPLFHAPGVIPVLLTHLLASPTPWPPVRMASHTNPWPAATTFPSLADDAPELEVGPLTNVLPLSHIDRVLVLPTRNLLQQLRLHDPNHAFLTCLAQGVQVSGLCASLSEAWLLREYARLHGYIVSAPMPVPLNDFAPGQVVPHPAFYTWRLEGRTAPAVPELQQRFGELHALVANDDGFTDDLLYAGTPDPAGGFVHLVHGLCLSLNDAMVYASADSDDTQPWTPVAGPVPPEVQSHPPQHAANPIERWYWALDLLQNFPVVEEI